VDWRLSKVTEVMVRANAGRRKEESALLGEDVLNGSGTEVDAKDLTTQAALLNAWTQTSNEFRVGYRTTDRDWDGAGLPTTYLVGDGIGAGANATAFGKFHRHSIDFLETFQYHWAGGASRAKAGVQYSLGKWRQNYLYGSEGIFQFGDLESFGNGGQGAFMVTESPRTVTEFEIQEYVVFGELLYQLSPGLSVLGGLRFDRQKFPKGKQENPIPPSPIFDSLFLGLRNNAVPDDKGNVAPRVGLIWQGGTNRSWSGSLGWSYHYGQLNPAYLAEAAVASGSLRVRRAVGSFAAWPVLPDSIAAPYAG
jgi:outer membrane receptor protein involved in Fe transport